MSRNPDLDKPRGFGENIPISVEQISIIRRLDDFDLVMLLSEIDQHGWHIAHTLLPLMERRYDDGSD